MVGHCGHLVSPSLASRCFPKPSAASAAALLIYYSDPHVFPLLFCFLCRSILQQLLVSITFPNFLEAGELGKKAAFPISFGNISGRRSGPPERPAGL